MQAIVRRSSTTQANENKIHVVEAQDKTVTWWSLVTFYKGSNTLEIVSFAVRKLDTRKAEVNKLNTLFVYTFMHYIHSSLSFYTHEFIVFDSCGTEKVQVMSIDGQYAWVCSVDEHYLGTGCIRVSLNKMKSLCLEYEAEAQQMRVPVTQQSRQKPPPKKRKTIACEPTMEHKVQSKIIVCFVS